MIRKILLILALLAAVPLLITNRSLAQTPASRPSDTSTTSGKSTDGDDLQATLDEDIKLMRKDIRSDKKQIVAANMDMTEDEALRFWPIYDRYTTDLSKINDSKAALIKEYVLNYATMGGDQAESYIRKRAAVEESIMQLRLKYVPAFREALTGRKTALFFQIDWRLGLLVDLQLAQMPLIDP